MDRQLLRIIEDLLAHAEYLEEFLEIERGKGRPVAALYLAGEIPTCMVEAKDLIESTKINEISVDVQNPTE